MVKIVFENGITPQYVFSLEKDFCLSSPQHYFITGSYY
jgi:hypothetical protein